jgi:hypothetical protein
MGTHKLAEFKKPLTFRPRTKRRENIAFAKKWLFYLQMQQKDIQENMCYFWMIKMMQKAINDMLMQSTQ